MSGDQGQVAGNSDIYFYWNFWGGTDRKKWFKGKPAMGDFGLTCDDGENLNNRNKKHLKMQFI